MAEDAQQLLIKAAEHTGPAVPSGLLEDLGAARGVNPPRSVLTSNLRRIYEVRLARWRDTAIPNCDGLPEFVAALRDEPGDQVVLSFFHTSRNTWLILLRPDFGAIDAAVRINERPKTLPSEDAIVRGEWP
jgi:hypothetical protein